ncbi:monosaccharide-sensing protein 2-like isoform X1 [Durio zibethinus]|uniref:Monosaccharide-sensing protein 2-like isoform X1 n=2 Tax=Durio zibethinus TaxID=66656 RepID=A0A6P6AX45_DURZI|nr:monosaccharide-sensing protein 2-like isoform X1 [Durio zibethinus]XP_022769435.1 monosaccharide-sensing protein 2-like isoform X1 [Durio zibethinus]XP_022769436.1 monosaccharide-sensing protein 2-like isoform X1 [Durio zibethinus]XP_022769438.1 monosaccharide-sensing protein 2-like isoform X1 [Durio zibethinus]XP_022769439.1 monosaccharide-sensing protein 2-like isoform X1 [Durio zibethinus]XP_022769440.1 monosaccharide-sensing protein 2-like isoform X1 [Durio zibethinus]XP_022769441.1 mo
MRGAALVAIAATVGNFLQGWDNATIAGAIVYIKNDLNLGTSVEGLVVAMSLIGATAITTCSGAISDWLGRRPMLIISSMLYFVSGLVMLWSPNVYILCIARLLDGFGIGLAVTLVPVYISETAPSEIRGLLNTLPQFSGSGGMFLSYCMVFGMSLMDSPSWRLMLGVLSIPSLLYFALTVFYLPESPRWLVSKGKMLEAKQVLQRLRGREDVSGEMALLVEGLGIGGETSIEEYIIGPADELADSQEPTADKEKIRLYGPEEGLSWVARPVTGRSILGLASRQGSMVNQSVPLMDPLVTLFGSVHEKLPETGSMRSMLFPNFGSMFSTAEPHVKNEHWDEESLQREGEDYVSDAGGGDSDDNLHSPLISRQTTSLEKDMVPPASHGSVLSMRRHSTLVQDAGESVGGTGIGGGWQLAWKWSEREGEDGKKEGGFKRIYLHQEGVPGSRRGSLVSLPGNDMTAEGEFIQAAALVSQPALYSKELLDQSPVGPAMVHPSETASKGPVWAALLDPGVKRALLVGIGIQILQQFSGINGVLYYTPQILEEAGVEVLLSSLGLSSDSASFLISAFTTLLMLPCIAVAMKLMDVSGRRRLLLTTIPVLIVSLIILVFSEIVDMGSVVNAAISTACVIIYFCCFVMGYGPIPNILCSEIFPTRVRGLCIAICALVYWIGDIIITYTLPVMLSSIGLAGIFGIYAVVCLISWVFVFLKVPETKGMPLEVITEFFAVGARQATATKNE